MAASIRDLGPRVQQAGGFLFKKYRRMGLRVINKTGSSIATDKLVALSGYDTTSGLPKIVLADADVAGHQDVFVTDGAIADGAQGHVYKGGVSAATVDTSSASAAGDPVYLDTTAGAWTATAPSTPTSRVIRVGHVVVKSSTVGQIHWDMTTQKGGVDDQTNGSILVHSLRQRVATADVNAGLTLLAAISGKKYRLVSAKAIAIGGNAGTVTTVDILGTQATSSVKLVAYAQASLTRSAVLTAGGSGATVLADGASFAPCDAGAAITIGKTGSALDTATAVDVVLEYTIE